MTRILLIMSLLLVWFSSGVALGWLLHDKTAQLSNTLNPFSIHE